ncbi:WD40-repeat-containing domain protein [Mycena filopes]|nr:WD40-repeat-containing domain protein [Mycena filopes]
MDSKPAVASSVARDIKPLRRPSTLLPKRETSATVSQSKPVAAVAGPSQPKRIIFGGPPSAIKQDPPKIPPPIAPVDEEDPLDPQEEYDVLRPFEHPAISAMRIEAPPEPDPEIDDPVLPRKRRYVDISSAPRPSSSRQTWAPKGVFIWDALRKFRPRSEPRPRFRSKRPRLGEALDMDHYVTAHRFRQAGGSINRILQHDGRVVVCSNTAGGNATAELDPYNKAGTLISWSKREPSKVVDLEQGSHTNLAAPHYSVHSIAYDPTRNILASSGDERTSLAFKAQGEFVPTHDLAFKPGESLLAVGERQLTIQNLATDDGRPHTFDLVDRKERNAHVTGPIAWGHDRTASLIFASSEPAVKNDNRGRHQAFDTAALRPAFRLHTSDQGDAGDALCVDPTGNTAALVTNDGVDSMLRIYDVGNRDSSPVQQRRLETFTTPDHEVNSIAFSPDSIYLAIGRDDNCTHVYDSRMLGRGILCNFRHFEADSSNGQNFYGVVKVHWVASRQTGRLGLVTGGNDGCVRLFNPLGGEQQGVVLAQADSDIAYFSVGDRFNGDHELVVGDSAGAVYIADGHANTSLV